MREIDPPGCIEQDDDIARLKRDPGAAATK
jgi:hypothetical protein